MLQLYFLIKRHIFFLAFISFLVSLIFFTYKDFGIAWDEKVFINVGKYYLIDIFNILHLSTNLTAGGFVPTPYHTLGHGAFYDVFIILASFFLPKVDFEAIHLLRALFAVPIFMLVYWIVSRLLSKVYGLIAMIFLLLFPRFYPDIFYNAIDIPTTLFFTLCLAYFIYYAETKQTILKSVFFGFLLAIAINQRLLLFYLPLFNAIFLFMNKKSLRIFLTSQFLILTSFFFFLHLTHPYLLAHPITGLFDIIQSAKQYPWNAAVLFDGQFYQAGVNPLPWYYLAKSMLITIPPYVLFLFVIGNARLFVPLLRRPSKSVNLFHSYLLSLFYIPFILNFILKPTLYDSWRHFMFLTIPIVIIAMFGLDWIFGHWKLVIGIFIFFNLFFVAKKMIELHPYEYLYYNSLVGGLKGAYGKYETDYLGLSYKDAVLWFNKNVNDSKKQYMIFVEGDPLSSTTYFKPNMVLTTDPLNADYIFTFTRWNFHERHPGKTIYSFRKEEIPLIFVKEVQND
ncbi:hypothetical protein A3C28_02875 [Candidatus Roizmanbacteria bacterium RIFCSPHIGHO2_02_FULL_39_9]|uniref:Glycosyltransferase RgtA/B/C/D-like domain-containing protein n=1 Tax=Candidatus Roizmanbacteria bacterium RIFCSPHIGHO2_02_FULL_39_9 TaxID=1802040 RepID=A0A1F7H5H1_9BACT|nr:MAG: hypothetical protein A3C28_02875 [Candidatus Roizmanbacteria bacterium RIFCSPHIGHO2_02_FULL_39_9]